MPGRVTPPAAKRAYNYRYRYGITIEQYDQMLAQQKGVCAICGAPPKRGRLHVDHDHEGGAVRELLCLVCNMSLQKLESPVWNANATDYLRKHHPERYLT